MVIALIFLPFALFFLILYSSMRFQRLCYHCGHTLPNMQSPVSRTARQWWKGGSTCSQCESDCLTDGGNPESGDVSLEYKLKWLVVLAVQAVLSIVLLVVLSQLIYGVPNILTIPDTRF